jgi:hypothetical protein
LAGSFAMLRTPESKPDPLVKPAVLPAPPIAMMLPDRPAVAPPAPVPETPRAATADPPRPSVEEKRAVTIKPRQSAQAQGRKKKENKKRRRV